VYFDWRLWQLTRGMRWRIVATVLMGLASAAVDPSEGCRFVERCPLAIEVCSHVTPPLVEERPGQAARCHVTAPSTR